MKAEVLFFPTSSETYLIPSPILSCDMTTTLDDLKSTTLKLLAYCWANDWKGYDPYDALNSPLFRYVHFLDFRLARLVATQLLKRSPINLRPLLLIPKTENPKAIALFLMALLKLKKIGLLENDSFIEVMIQKLITFRSPARLITRNSEPVTRNSYWCWGYNFDWQTRRFLVPKYTPNIICTSFAGNALLDAYEKIGDSSYLEMAQSAGDFIIKGLNMSETNNGICFSYTPLDKSQVHNANLLGAAFLARLYSISRNKEFFDYALSAARFSVDRQANDGSWPYGENELQKWIDNFHTGYNLVALHRFSRYTENGEFVENINKGFHFYKNHFFTDGCLAKYYHNRLYPIDIHSIAQSVITLLELKDLDQVNVDLALVVCQWSIDNMKNEKGFFYYQKKRFYMNKISYMRWSQAWMLLALSMLLEHCGQARDEV